MRYKPFVRLIISISIAYTSVLAGSGLVVNQSGDNSSSTVQVKQSNSDLSQGSTEPYAEVNQLGGALSDAKIGQFETDNSSATITQSGDNQRSEIVQRNIRDALANTQQFGSDNQAKIRQEAIVGTMSSDISADIYQAGQGNSAEIGQLDSTAVVAIVNQSGNNNSNQITQQLANAGLISLDVAGNSNTTQSTQENSNRDISNINITGNSNIINSRQGSADHHSENNMIIYHAGGKSNIANLSQYNSAHVMDIVQDGTSNSINICQGNDATCNSSN